MDAVTQVESKPTTKRGFSWSFIAALLALLIAIALSAAALLYVRNLNFVFWSLTTNDRLLHRQIQQLQGIQTTLLRHVQQQQAALDEVQQLAQGQKQAWVVAEVKYLIRLASYNLSYSHDASAALALLQTADQRLARLNDPAFNQVRQQLANVITPLQAAAKIDMAGILAKLNALQLQVPQLPLITPPAFNAPQKTADEKVTPATSRWRQAWENSLATLKALVVVRHHQAPIEPMLDQEQLRYLQQNIVLQLQQAQWAVLHGQQTIYQNSVQQALQAVQTYFASASPQTTAFAQTLQQLQQVNIQPELPALTNVLDALAQAAPAAARAANQAR